MRPRCYRLLRIELNGDDVSAVPALTQFDLLQPLNFVRDRVVIVERSDAHPSLPDLKDDAHVGDHEL